MIAQSLSTFLLRNVSMMLSACSFLLALVSIQLGRRLNYIEHLPMFNSMAAVILALVCAGFVAALGALVKTQAKSPSSWLAVALALVILASYLFDD